MYHCRVRKVVDRVDVSIEKRHASYRRTPSVYLDTTPGSSSLPIPGIGVIDVKKPAGFISSRLIEPFRHLQISLLVFQSHPSGEFTDRESLHIFRPIPDFHIPLGLEHPEVVLTLNRNGQKEEEDEVFHILVMLFFLSIFKKSANKKQRKHAVLPLKVSKNGTLCE